MLLSQREEQHIFVDEAKLKIFSVISLFASSTHFLSSIVHVKSSTIIGRR